MDKPLDKISEAYYGKMGEAFGKKTRERINWVISNVKGENILDIGCSQGIIPILLGREGKKVLGVDILEESINYAKEALESEHISLKENVRFETTNYVSDKNITDKYDTVLLTEVLEHIGDVDSFLAKVKENLIDDGILIVTVPFGINDYFDHKRTYYYLEIAKQISNRLKIVEVNYLNGWMGIIAKNKKEYTFNEKEILRTDYINKLETSFNSLEKSLRMELTSSKVRSSNFEKKCKGLELSLKEKEDKYKKIINEKEESIEVIKKENEKLIQEKIALEEKSKEFRLSINENEDKYKKIINEKEKSIEVIKKENEGLLQEKIALEENTNVLKEENEKLIAQVKRYESMEKKLRASIIE